MRISLELIPRDPETILKESKEIVENFKKVNMVNIPDLLRFELRSWNACLTARTYFENTLPHFRAVDIDLNQPLPMATFLRENRFKEVIIISGDLPQDLSRKMYPSNVLQVIKKFKKEIPGLKVYAAVDPYRHGFRAEQEYILAKKDAGADGFFTQPFFDLRLLDIYLELLSGETLFWGSSPVLSSRSKNYWETRNRAIFPKDFEPTMEWNRQLVKAMLERLESVQGNIYLMPIKAPLLECYQGIL